MLTVTYDPADGVVMQDAKMEPFVKGILTAYFDGELDEVRVGSETLVNHFRIMLVRKAIEPDEIQFRFQGRNIKAYSNGGLRSWPRGFCDYSERLMLEML